MLIYVYVILYNIRLRVIYMCNTEFDLLTDDLDIKHGDLSMRSDDHWWHDFNSPPLIRYLTDVLVTFKCGMPPHVIKFLFTTDVDCLLHGNPVIC